MFGMYIEAFYAAMTSKPVSKHGSKDLSSTNAEEEKCSLTPEIKNIRETLNRVNKKLTLDQLLGDVKDVKQSLDFYITLVDVLKEDNASLKLEVANLKQQTANLQNDNTRLSESILDLQCRSMQDDIIIHGIPEENTSPEGIALETQVERRTDPDLRGKTSGT